jgi:hypothetical protein
VPRTRTHRPRTPRRALLAAALLASLACASCAARRTLRVASDPPGSSVTLDGHVVEIPFEHYGHRRLTVSHPGYRSWTDSVHLRTPWYQIFPFDLVTEVLLPFGWSHSPGRHVTLEPGLAPDERPNLRTALERAEALRRAGPEGPRELPPPRQTPALELEDRTTGLISPSAWAIPLPPLPPLPFLGGDKEKDSEEESDEEGAEEAPAEEPAPESP